MTEQTEHLVVDEGACKGHGLCFSGWPEMFDLNDDGVAMALVDVVPEGKIAQVREAIAACPEQAIHLRANG